MSEYFFVIHPDSGNQILTSGKTFENQLADRGFVKATPEAIEAAKNRATASTENENAAPKAAYRQPVRKQ